MDTMLTTSLAQLRTRCVTPIVRILPPWVTPNHLSLARLVLVVPLGYFLFTEHWWPALLTYLVAALTDALDGELARAQQQVTRLGARLDPTIDKVLHGVIALAFFPVAPFLLGTIIALDVLLFLVGLAVVLTQKNVRIAGANVFGKWKLLLQAVAVLLLFGTRLVPGALPQPALNAVLGTAIAFAVLSMAGYVRTLAERPANQRDP